ncbi:hypothetical protein GB937_006038 [Aspergillus fischeri]|nr:hypothetical protein GB937_006038 [Aspergillus fischeri]
MPRDQGRVFYVANSMAGMMPTEPAEVVAYPRKKAELMNGQFSCAALNWGAPSNQYKYLHPLPASTEHDTGKATSNFPQGAGIHLIDFAATQGRVQQYQNSRDTMCASAPRFSLYPFLTEMNCLQIFNPPLTYNDDGTDASLAALKTSGQVMCNPGPNEKPTAQQILQLQKWTGGRVSTPTYGVKKRSVKARQNGRVCFADHRVVVVSEHGDHTASELCKSTSAAGPDFVSTKEGLFCDMCTGELWPLCSQAVPTGCFDLDLKAMRASNGAVTSTGLHARDVITGRDIPEKEYKKVVHWK